MKSIDAKKAIFITDLHFGCRSNSMDFLKIQRDYFNEWFIPQIKKILKKESDTILFVLGDIFDSKMSLQVAVLNQALDIFKQLSNLLPVHILCGNHDAHAKHSNEINSLKPLALLPNVTVYEEPEILNISGERFFIMPWRVNLEEEKKAIRHAIDKNNSYLLAHTEIHGLKYNKFTSCSGGNEMSDYAGFKKVFSGHIHWRQEGNNIIYVGSPYSTNKGDSGNQKGIYILNIETEEIEFIKNDYSPKYIKLKLEDILEWDVETYQQKINNNFVEIEYLPTYINFNFSKLIDDVPGYKTLEYYSADQGESFVDEIDEDNDNIDFGDYTELKKFNLLELSEQWVEATTTTEEFKIRMLQKMKDLFNESLMSMKEEAF